MKLFTFSADFRRRSREETIPFLELLPLSFKLLYLWIGRERIYHLLGHAYWCTRITGKAHVRKGAEESRVRGLVEHRFLNDEPNLLIDI